MINAAETIAPQHRAGARINTDKTIAPGGYQALPVLLAAGDTISDSFVISKAIESKGTQSNVYVAKKWGKTYAVKVYNNGWHPSPEIERFLATIRHPNIARVIESGEYRGSYYEIYDYYPEGTLQEAGPLPVPVIRNVVVPSINEGLHALHESGIVHCDIKPSNLFFSDERDRLIIGDCGISGFVNSSGKYIDTLRGTPEYAPRVKTLGWNAVMSPAYDYGAFGLVLCKAILGRSLFEGMSVEQISAERDRGIVLPSQISGRLQTLVMGLIDEDEDARWGYNEVKRWCQGEFMRPAGRSIYTRQPKEKKKVSLVFGRFDGETVTVSTLSQLSNAIMQHWDQARKVVKRADIVPFVRQFDESLTGKIRELARIQDSDAAVFRLLTYINGGSDKIYYCGKTYESLDDYVSQLASGRDEVAKKFLVSGMLIFYLRFNGKNEMMVDKLEQLIKRNGAKDMAAIRTICFALQGTSSIDIYGTRVSTLNDLVSVLSGLSVSRIDALLRNSSFQAWLNRMGFERDVRRMKEML